MSLWYLGNKVVIKWGLKTKIKGTKFECRESDIEVKINELAALVIK